ncbi:DUF3592 domain-containing protein [Myxococcus sp. 1LA]
MAAIGLSLTLGMLKPQPKEPTAEATPQPWAIPHIPQAILALGIFGFGVALVGYGFRNLRTNRQLISEGVAVVGRVVRGPHKQPQQKGIFVIYQFEDEHGTVHKGIHGVSAFGDALLHAEAGQDVTVLYDARNPTTNMVDLNNLRPMDAPRRRRPEAP